MPHRTLQEEERSLWTLFGTFFKIGLFTFGGGYAMIALLENEFITKKHWLGRDEFLDMAAIAESTPGPVASSVLNERPSSEGTNMPATTTMPARAAMSRTALAQGPSNGSATPPSGTPKRTMVASGKSTSDAPASTARRVYSSTSVRLAAGSVLLWIWASAIRIPERMAPA